MMRQYLEIKSRYPDSILFFRMGDFYEMFLDDAKVAAAILDITLTSRNKGGEDEIPFCGVPFHSAQPYIARLIEAGHRVAICEQVEDPKQAKGIVRRDVVKVVTPALVTEAESLTPGDNSYLLALYKAGDIWGSAWLDLSTGEFCVAEEKGESGVASRLAAISPRELLLPEQLRTELPRELLLLHGERLCSTVPDWVPDHDYCAELICKRYGIQSPASFGLDSFPAATVASGMALHYLQENRLSELPHLRDISIVQQEQFLMLDPATRRNLELTSTMLDNRKNGSLLGTLDRTRTAMGSRMLKQWLSYPLLQPEPIRQRLAAVEELILQPELRDEVIDILKGVQDLERLNGRIAMASATPRDLRALHDSIRQLPLLKQLLAPLSSPLLVSLHIQLDLLEDLRLLISASVAENPPFSLREGGIIADGFNEELDQLRSISREGKGYISGLEARERNRSGIPSLKIRYNKVFGYYIEVTKAHLASVPSDYIRRQTIAGGERYVTEELKSYEEKVLGAEERICGLEYQLFQQIRETVASAGGRILASATTLATADLLIALATVAMERNYCRPKIVEESILEIVEGRHPVVEGMNLAERFVPNDTSMDTDENQILMITGPNMAGKSTYMRQVALIVLMAQIGSFVPAKTATIGIADRIFTRVGAGDNLARGESTFMVEMKETAHILRNATSRSLVVLDEIGRGTSTFDGLSIAWAVAEFLHDSQSCRPRTLFATHYHELADLAATCGRISNCTVAVREWNDQVIFLRTIIAGAASHSYGIQVARLAGMPLEVIERAKELLKTLEQGEFVHGEPRLAKTEKKEAPRGGRQFSLFEPEGDLLRERLKKLNISDMTPLQALNLLDDLKRMI